jgi:YfiH family protein
LGYDAAVSDVLRSRLLLELGFCHGFNLRTGGASEGPFGSFNLGRAVGDELHHVAENHRRFAEAVGYAPGRLYEVSQVHGSEVRAVRARDDAADVRRHEADALCAPAGAIAIGVRIADCVPVLLADPETGAVAAAHAGWRGTVSGVVEAAVAALRGPQGDARQLAVAIFPHIGRCCFEVGDDVAQSLLAVSPDPEVVDRSRNKPHVDLAAIITAKLVALGLPPERIERVDGCTRCQDERFFSYRRDGKRSGRHLAAIVSR